jgi:ribosomal protein S18 acetylase RimI-like enzyme
MSENQLKRSVVFRRPRPADLPALYRLDRLMWFAHMSVEGTDFSQQCAINDVHGMLMRMTWARLAVVDGSVAGVIASCVTADTPYPAELTDRLDADWQQMRESMTSPAARKLLRAMDQDQAENQRFEAHARADTDAEIVLFLLDASVRGRHLGSRMYDMCIDHFREMGARSYFLFTDSTCSYGFYDHRGLTRIASMDGSAPFFSPIRKYIYVGLSDEVAQRSLRQNPQRFGGAA